MDKEKDYNPPTTSSRPSLRSERAPKIEKLNLEIKNCKKCSLWKLRKNTVPGEGPTDVKFTIFGYKNNLAK